MTNLFYFLFEHVVKFCTLFYQNVLKKSFKIIEYIYIFSFDVYGNIS